MATAINSVDVLSPSERKLVANALALKLASIGRSIKSATNPAIIDALNAEAVVLDSLMMRFR